MKSKIGKPPVIRKAKKLPPSNRCHVLFDNKAIDFINLRKILRDKDVLNALPRNLKSDVPTVIYKL